MVGEAVTGMEAVAVAAAEEADVMTMMIDVTVTEATIVGMTKLQIGAGIGIQILKYYP